MHRLRFALALAVAPLFLALPAHAEEDASSSRTINVTVYGNDACPQGAPDEIVVCARQPETERYRIPKKLRGKRKKDDAAGASWASRVEGLEEASRPMRPGSCSASGSFGQTGCVQSMLRQWFAEKRQKNAEEDAIP
ncbi:hypothetical protein NX02_05960 [Sphingomonas sanxanigenens DSM 19645 = NX02]|uniref:Uncharacterized protein n=2 Tax=Sphingomonas sanxanigenens TaxID=397260 RepID=W0A8W0_9SPHN|nr:hypothetical protein NX02_05960 [Sphingomonas sanxanigenens DSM 19645 = NX02]